MLADTILALIEKIQEDLGLTTDEAAAELSVGAVRYARDTLPTDFTYTGQRNEVLLDISEMGARWYVSKLSRWASADTIVPDTGNPQSLNRFSYVRNNP